MSWGGVSKPREEFKHIDLSCLMEETALLIREIWADIVESDFLKAFLEHPSLKVLKKTELSWSKED